MNIGKISQIEQTTSLLISQIEALPSEEAKILNDGAMYVFAENRSGDEPKQPDENQHAEGIAFVENPNFVNLLKLLRRGLQDVPTEANPDEELAILIPMLNAANDSMWIWIWGFVRIHPALSAPFETGQTLSGLIEEFAKEHNIALKEG